ncbi:FtsX-like permease family protein [Mucilaginibacter pallidiroseus]|uniref:FtsX-like permease family protein n=1 Tax=Mucilaginibacter pallidiroseus TaxID=2599295 RepID=A0A563UJ00_9SPHI|nr:ABC transporter permease [Mucilaginibacter pallidiroseus]TWR31364.1 FtsX-like permease family protein [Mucilaginibacter pallidiroseus]
MIKNYLKTAWRNLVQNRSTSIISVAGLAVGICCFLLLATYLINELRYDRFHAKADRIVRMVFSYQSADDKEPRNTAMTQTAPLPLFKQQFSEIEGGVRIFGYDNERGAAVQYSNKLFSEKKMLLADDGFFDIFSFKFLSGSATKALSDPSSVVLSASTAKKYFGDEAPVGKVLKVNQKDLMVTGVIEDVPAYSQMKFDMIASSAISTRSKELRWDAANNYSYFLLKPEASYKAVEGKINAYFNNLFKSENNRGGKAWYTLEPLADVHLKSNFQGGLEPSGNIKYIYILGSVAVILLLLACVNFLNLVTARSAERAREIGVRKVMGARRGQLFFQFITEAGIITMFSIGLGLLLLKLCFPWFSNFTGQQLALIPGILHGWPVH